MRCPGHSRLRALVLLLNTCGLLAYLGWLMFGGRQFLHAQEGILFLLPCLPFVLIYVFLFVPERPEEHGVDEEDG